MANKSSGYEFFQKFSVTEFFANESYATIQFTDAEKAMKYGVYCSTSNRAKHGFTTKVTITDSDDNINYEWLYNKGVVFPKVENLSSNERVY